MRSDDTELGGSGGSRTRFAPAEREGAAALGQQISSICSHPLLDAILEGFGGAVVVVNATRQIVAFNVRFLELAGIDDPPMALGMRLGEALRCVNASDAPCGCGTAECCATCGVTVSMLVALDRSVPAERECRLSHVVDGQPQPFEMQARAFPVELSGQPFVIMTLRDIRPEKKWEATQRLFFHDMMNVITGLHGTSEQLKRVASDDECARLARRAHALASQLVENAEAHRVLCRDDPGTCPVRRTTFALETILCDLRDGLAGAACARGKQILLPETIEPLQLEADRSMVERVLRNMLTNALEATEQGGVVRIGYALEREALTFEVWNAQPIPDRVAARIFERFFTTKGEPGRGLGSYSMKIFGERFLGGKVQFETTQSGTTFSFRLPLPAIPAG